MDGCSTLSVSTNEEEMWHPLGETHRTAAADPGLFPNDAIQIVDLFSHFSRLRDISVIPSEVRYTRAAETYLRQRSETISCTLRR